jgi:hypothetical protein
MAVVKKYNLARMSTATTGTGNTITLGSAVSGFLSFSAAGVSDGETVRYGIKDGANSEVGDAVYTASGTTLVRTVDKSTNSNANINLSGSAEVLITASAKDFRQIWLDDGSVGSPSLTFDADPDNGAYRIGTNNWGLYAGGTKVVDLSAAGVGVLGSNTNDSAAAGFVGEIVSQTVTNGAPVSLTNATAKTVTSISLTAGDWDIVGTLYFNGGATTTVAFVVASISTTTDSLDTTNGARHGLTYYGSGAPFGSAFGYVSQIVGPDRITLSATTTVYLVAQANFATSTCAAYGKILARRRR